MTDTASGARPIRRHSWFFRFGAMIVVLGLIAIITTVIVRPVPPNSNTIVQPPPSSTLQVGDRLPVTPEFSELDAATRSSIAALSAHHPTVINFFASFCTACAAEMKTFATVARAQPGVSFIGIDTNEPNVATARSLVRHSGVAYPVLEDNAALTLANSYGIANLPTTFFVNAEGKITAEFLGSASAHQLRADIATT